MSVVFDPDGCPPVDAGLFGLPFTTEDARLVLIPVPWDVTTSYRPGTHAGPAAIRAASHQLDLFDVELGEPWRSGIALAPESERVAQLNRTARADAEAVIAVGGRIGTDTVLAAALARVNAASEELNAYVAAEVERHASRGKIVGILGGDHSVPFGAIQTLARRHGPIGVLHVDAHADLRDTYEGFVWSHASIMHNVLTRIPEVSRLVQVGIRDLSRSEHATIVGSGGRVVPYYDVHLAARAHAGETWSAIVDEIVDQLPERVYVSFDIDGLEAAFAPHTGTPVPGGLHFYQACALIRRVVERGRRIVGFDLNEVAPGPEGDEWDANVGARILYKLCGWTLKSWGA